MNRFDPLLLDLNLLKTFDVLSQERSVTRAAERLHLGQPAVSHALGRLRELLGDELFIRSATGMEPTARARELEGPVRSALAQLVAALSTLEKFDASTQTRTFAVGISDWLAADFMPTLLRNIRESAPHITLRIHSLDDSLCARLLDEGAIDLAVGYPIELEAWHRSQALFTESHVCVFNPEHVAASTPITLDEYTRYPHLLMSHSGNPTGFVDEELRQFGRSRRVIASGTQFLLVPYVLQAQPIIATLPTRFAQRCCELATLQASELPFAARSFEVAMVWHARNHSSAAQAWLRTRIQGAVSGPSAV
jgi:LysR family transcriptional regulator, mexEF-oprN operon transcriptional activator